MKLFRGDDWSRPNWQDHLRLWSGIAVVALAAVVCVCFGWAFDSISASIGEVRQTIAKWRGRA